MNKEEFVIGIVGGMGSYATLEFFGRVLKKFPAEKEWDRPRVIIDNRCTMPSRVRAILYNEKREEVTNELLQSIESIIQMGGEGTKVVLACNTSHIFLDDIYKLRPNLERNIVNIISKCAEKIKLENVKEAYLLATEGTIQSQIYQKVFSTYNIKIISPDEKEFSTLRFFIENVKQDLVDENVKMEFFKYINKIEHKYVILGCTEFSALFYRMNKQFSNLDKKIIEPLDITLDYLYELYCVDNN